LRGPAPRARRAARPPRRPRHRRRRPAGRGRARHRAPPGAGARDDRLRRRRRPLGAAAARAGPLPPARAPPRPPRPDGPGGPPLGEHFAPPPPPDAVAAHAVITEWEVGGTGSMQHDITVHPDGRIYSADTTQDKLYRLDPRTGERRTFDIPRGDSPLGGVFTIMQPIPANADAHVAPHSLQVAPDGSIWITLCLGNKIARFDPRTERFEIFRQEDGLYPHTLRFDARGRAWYTLAVSNQVAMIDPRS